MVVFSVTLSVPHRARRKHGARPAAGSWIIGGFEHFDDGQQHVTLWSVDAAGNGVRLGCNPNADTYYSGVLSSLLPTATAAFAIAAAGNRASGSYDLTLVRLAR